MGKRSTLIESCDCKLLERELVILNPCRVPTHYRLGLLLAGLPQASRTRLDLRQRYGGTLIPAFWSGAELELAERRLLEPPRRSPTIVPLDRHGAHGALAWAAPSSLPPVKTMERPESV